jgi:hypothetical protein
MKRILTLLSTTMLLGAVGLVNPSSAQAQCLVYITSVEGFADHKVYFTDVEGFQKNHQLLTGCKLTDVEGFATFKVYITDVEGFATIVITRQNFPKP